jgi:choline monooxygenase
MAAQLGDIIGQFDPTRPLDRARTIPAAWYFDAGVFDLERRTVFAGWQPAARLDQLAQPGSFATADIAGEPVVVLRDESGTLRAFHNVCRHRAAVVVPEPCGTLTRLRCRYHGWTYDLAGRLRGVPEFDGVCEFERDDHGLVPLAVETWDHFAWVHAGTPHHTLRQFLGPLTHLTEDAGLATLRWAGRKSYDVGCNWKVYVDNYLDGGYHINTVHPGLAGVIDYSQYRTELHPFASVQVSPLVGAADAVGSVRAGDQAYYAWVFPNFMVNVYEGVADTNIVWPLGPDRCRVVFDFFFSDQTDDYIRRSIEVADEVQDEDMVICEEVQRGLRSRTYDTGRFSVKREAGGYHFHRLLAAELRRGTGPG